MTGSDPKTPGTQSGRDTLDRYVGWDEGGKAIKPTRRQMTQLILAIEAEAASQAVEVLRGIAGFLACYPAADYERLVERLALVGPAAIIRGAQQARLDRSRRGTVGGPLGSGGGTAAVLTWRYERLAVMDIYNWRLRKPLNDLTVGELRRLGSANAESV
jgi:hypothetical protein